MKRIAIFVGLKIVEIIGGLLVISSVPFAIGKIAFKLGYGFCSTLAHRQIIPFHAFWIDGTFYLLCFSGIAMFIYLLCPVIYKWIKANWELSKKLSE